MRRTAGIPRSSVSALLSAGLLFSFGCGQPPQPPSSSAPTELEGLTGAPFKVVWCQDREGMKDAYALGRRLFLMGYDSSDGKGERALLPGMGNYSKPMITPGGEKVVFSDRESRKVFVLNWDGTGLAELADGRALDCWRDPETLQDWVYVGDAAQDHPRSHRRIIRYRLDNSRVSEPVSTDWVLNENNFQLSGDGRYASANVEDRGAGILDLGGSTWESQGGGCWPDMAPDSSYLLWRLASGHRRLLIGRRGETTFRTVDISSAPGVDGHEVFHPRWGSHPRFMVMSGPYKEGFGLNRIGNGGPGVEVFIGRFSPDYTAVEAWGQVSRNEYADFYPDLWIKKP